METPPQDGLGGPQRDAGVLWIAYALGLIQYVINQVFYGPLSLLAHPWGRTRLDG